MVKKFFQAFLLASFLASPAFAVREICGTGIDEDSAGSPADASCGSIDSDRDGYTTDGTGLGYDCDDSNRYMPRMPWTKDTCTGNEAKKCNTETGSFAACTTPSETGTNYYVHCDSGSDAADCSFATPCLSILKFTQYITASPPGGYIGLAAGTNLWFLGGTCTETYTDGSVTRGFYTRQDGSSGSKIREWGLLSGTGPATTIDVSGTCDGSPYCAPWVIEGGDYHDTRGLKLTGGTHDGTLGIEGGGYASDGDNNTIWANWITANHGPNGSNPCGINLSISPSGYSIAGNRINDNRDTAAGVNENERQVCLFGGTNNDISYNIIYNTAAHTDANDAAGCLVWKHGSLGATNEIHHNVAWNCFQTAYGSGNSGTWIHHNLALDSERGVMLQDFGGNTYIQDELIEFNTFLNAGFEEVNATATSGGIGAVEFSNNIITSFDTSFGNEDALFTIDTYGSNGNRTTFIVGNLLTSDTNCLYTPGGTVMFCDYCSDSGGVDGDLVNLADWRTLGFDVSSSTVDPVIEDDTLNPTASACLGKGWEIDTDGGGGGPSGAHTFTSFAGARRNRERIQ
jgi:hypothetical protein